MYLVVCPLVGVSVDFSGVDGIAIRYLITRYIMMIDDPNLGLGWMV